MLADDDDTWVRFNIKCLKLIICWYSWALALVETDGHSVQLCYAGSEDAVYTTRHNVPLKKDLITFVR